MSLVDWRFTERTCRDASDTDDKPVRVRERARTSQTPYKVVLRVAYWSSHLDGAKSERIVPSGHGSPLNPQAIAEVHRILQLNAASR